MPSRKQSLSATFSLPVVLPRLRRALPTLLLIPGVALSQIPPDAGTVLKQVEPRQQAPLPKASDVAPAPPEPMQVEPGQSITVKQFRFAGNTLLTAAQLTPALTTYIGRPLSFAELQQAADEIAKAYREAGWIVKTYLPRQDITEGVVTIQIIEAVFGGVKIEGAEPQRIDAAIVRGAFERQPRGEPLNADTLDRALLLADDLPGVAIAGTLRQGLNAGETDLALRLADEAMIIGEAGVDNIGSRSTGAARLTLAAALNSPLRIGDQLNANLIHSEGIDYARANYSVPLGSDGWRIGANASRMDYRLVAREFRSLDASGSASSAGIDVSYPLIRSRAHNLYLSLAMDDRRFDNAANGDVTTRYDVQALTFNLSGNLFDGLGGGGANLGILSLTAGTLDLDGSPNQAADAVTTRSDGQFTKLSYVLSRQQSLFRDLSLYAMVSGQLANKNLDSSEKFYLGGANGVRAYPASEAGGSEGMLATMELRWRLDSTLVLTGFADWGRVRINRNNNYPGAPDRNHGELAGLGISLAGEMPFGVSLKATYAHRLGSNPFRNTVTGDDQDGSHVKDRFWLQASMQF